MPETYNHYYGALRFMYKRVLKLNWDEDEIPRMKRDRSLPTVLSRAEVNTILDVTTNLKYKAIFAVMYSGGLRVSEATHLHYDDISRSNHSIHIRNTKNRMDRYTILADRTLDILTGLFRNYPLLLLYPMYLNFASSNCLPHLPYIVRFIIFNLLLVPSTNPLL